MPYSHVLLHDLLSSSPKILLGLHNLEQTRKTSFISHMHSNILNLYNFAVNGSNGVGMSYFNFAVQLTMNNEVLGLIATLFVISFVSTSNRLVFCGTCKSGNICFKYLGGVMLTMFS